MKTLCGVLVLLLLAGCSSPSTISYYQLPVAPPAVVGANAAVKRLYVEPVQVASYLNGRGLVMQLSDVELVMARQHLWAESLDQQLQRQIRDRVLLHAPAYGGLMQAQSDSVRLSVQLDAFHGQAEGYAIISGRFSLSDQIHTQPFNIRVALTNDGYAALVQALGEGLQQLSMQIAQQLNSKV
jgi:uncharacterized protein